MLQSFKTVLALGAVLLISTAGVFVQNIDLGLAPNSPQIAAKTINDPSSNELFEANLSASEPTEPQKLASAVSLIEAKNEKAEAKEESKKVQVASQTVYKPQPQIVPEEIESMIRKYASEYGADAEVMISIAKCESGFRPDAVSPSGAYHGMYQFVASTWQSNRRAMGLSDDLSLMKNAEESIKTAAFKMGRDGYGAWPACSQKAFAALALR